MNCYNYETGYKRTQYEKVGLQFTDISYVEAKYIQSVVRKDNGNRLVEALPPIRSKEDCSADFTNLPLWAPEIRNKTIRERKELCECLSELRVPRGFIFDVDYEVHSMMVRGYRARIPNPCPGADGPGFYKTTGESISGALLIGDSGAGKTTAVLHVLNYYPQLIIHEMDNARMLQIPYIKVVCPPDASVKAFYDLCLGEIERITGNTFVQYRRSTADTKAEIFRRQALRYNIGLIVVDEVQNVMNAQKKNLMQHFLNLSNVLSIPFLFIGTEIIKSFFEKQEFYIKRRTGNLIKASLFQKDIIWDFFLKKMWKYQYTKECIPFSEEFSDVFFTESGGNIDRVLKLFLKSQLEAIETGFDTVEGFTPDFIRWVSRGNFEISYKELLERADEKAIPLLPKQKKSFHEMEEIKKMIVQGTGIEEKKEQIKYHVVENIASFTNGTYKFDLIERTFDDITRKMNVSKMDEHMLSMEVLKKLMTPTEAEDKKMSKKRNNKKKVEISVEQLPLFEGIEV